MFLKKSIIFLNTCVFIVAPRFLFLHLPKWCSNTVSSLFLIAFLGGFNVLLHIMLLCSLNLACLLKTYWGKKKSLFFPSLWLSYLLLGKVLLAFMLCAWLPAALPIDCCYSTARSRRSLRGGDQTSTTGILQGRSSSRACSGNTVYITQRCYYSFGILFLCMVSTSKTDGRVQFKSIYKFLALTCHTLFHRSSFVLQTLASCEDVSSASHLLCRWSLALFQATGHLF